MKLNEAKYRSPEWLRNFVDFEVNTGEDIKGEPSKKRTEEQKTREDQQAREDVRREEEKQKEIERELETLYRSMVSDFSSNRYSDKVKTPRVNGEIVFHYTFENGKVFKLEGYKIYWDNSIYKIDTNSRSKFVRLVNEIISKGGTRPSRSGYDRYDSYGGSRSRYGSGSSDSSGSSQQRTSSNTSSSTSSKWQDHPKGTMYQNLKDTVKLREEQLKRASGSDREALQNELNAAKKMLDNLNKKYSFESNIQNFSQFNQIFEKSKFVDDDEFNELLDKVNDTGLTSLTDIEKKRLDLFSMDDEPILDVIDQMADLTAEFKILNKKIKSLSDQGKKVDASNLFRDQWGPMNDEMIKLEREIKSYGIEVDDEIFMTMMNKHRSDVYGYDDDELEMDI